MLTLIPTSINITYTLHVNIFLKKITIKSKFNNKMHLFV